MHDNSIKSYYELAKELGEKQFQIYNLFCSQKSTPLTDRQVKDLMNLDDMNQVRPRINELIKKDLLMEITPCKCQTTGKTVRRLKIKGNDSNQMDLL